MAIAFDAAGTRFDALASSLTFAHTCTGNQRILFVGIQVPSASDLVSGVTYAGVAMTRVARATSPTPDSVYLYVLANPASGTNNVVVSLTSSINVSGRGASYTGAKQTSTVDNSATASTSSGTALTVTLTPVADNCWTVAVLRNNQTNIPTSNAGTTERGVTGTLESVVLADSNGPIHPAASKSLGITWSPANNAAGVMASFAPATDSGKMFAVF